MKYIMYETEFAGVRRRFPIIFPSELVHKEVDRAFQAALRRHGAAWADANPVSAGEINVTNATCHGNSETLKLGSNGIADTSTVLEYDYFHGVQEP